MLSTATRLRNRAVDTFAPTPAAGVFIACITHGNNHRFPPLLHQGERHHG